MKRKPKFVRAQDVAPQRPLRPVWGVLLERSLSHADKVLFPLLHIAAKGFPFLPINYGRTDLIRNKMALMTLGSQYTHLIMLDADHIHPVDVIERLMVNFAKNPSLKVVGGLNFRRGEPYEPCAFIKADDGKFLPMSSWPQGLVKVDALGTGCIAIAREVFEEIEPPWFYNNYDPALIWRDIWQGEDMGFATKCKASGIDQYVDTTITSPHLIDAMVNEEAYRVFLKDNQHEEVPLTEVAKDYVNPLGDAKNEEDQAEENHG